MAIRFMRCKISERAAGNRWHLPELTAYSRWQFVEGILPLARPQSDAYRDWLYDCSNTQAKSSSGRRLSG